MRYAYHPIPRSQRGFTLVELMVTIAILGILLMVGLPLTRAWIDRTRADSAAASLKTAIFDARVIALRNPNNQLASDVATRACIDSTTNQINVILLDLNSTASCNDTTGYQVIKSLPFAEGVTFKQGTTSISCVAFNSNGLLNTTSCAATLNTFTVGKNSETADVNIL